MSRKVHCMSLSSIYILYNHTPTARLTSHPEPWLGLLIFHCPEVVHTIYILRPDRDSTYAVRPVALFLVRASRQHREPEPYIGCSPCLNSPLSACDLSDTLWAFSTRAVRLYVRRGVFGPFAKICTAPIPKMGQTLAKICTGDLSGKGLRK